jgi:hypothetical protein
VLGERLHQTAPPLAVWSESRFGVAQIALEYYSGAVVERVRERCGRVNPPQAVSLQWQRRKKRRASGEWVNGRAEIVEEAGKREFEGARGATGLRLRFEDVNVHAVLREGDGGCEPVGSSANDAGPALRRFRIHERPVFIAVILWAEARVAIRWR